MDDTAPDLQPQLDRLDVAREEWRGMHGHPEPMEERLSQLTERCTELLNNWTQIDERHARAVRDVETRLSEWSAIENRLQQDAVERLRELERNIEHEWKSLRQIHEEPVKQLREQAAALGETCVAAANLAIRGFERAEARFAALEADLQRRLTELAENLQATLAEGRAAPKALGSNVAPFPLEGVMRIHEELREPGSTGSHTPSEAASPVLAAADASASREAPSVSQLSAGALALSTRMESLEREVTSEKEELRETATQANRLRRDWRLGIGVASAAALLAVILGIWLQLHVSAQLNDASTRVAAAERQAQAASDNAARQIASTRADAERQIAEARQTALKAAIVSNVLAAPDLIRFNLTSQDQSRASAQVLWSRSHGLVVSASRLSPPPPTHVYQFWLLTAGSAISAGVITPDQGGRGTLALDSLANVVPPVTGALVTLEADGGQSSPAGAVVLARGPQ